MENKTKIIITRKSEWMNRMRQYKVFIDGVETGLIKNDATEEYSVAPGTHSIQCKLSWYSSIAFAVDLKKDEIEYLRVRSGMKYYWPLFFILFAGLLINIFSKGYSEKPLWIFVLQIVLILPALIYLLYYLTLGRKNYLVIEEDKENVFS